MTEETSREWWEDIDHSFLWRSYTKTHGVMDERSGYTAVSPHSERSQSVVVNIEYLKEIVDWVARLETQTDEVHLVVEEDMPVVIDPMSDTDLSYVLCPRIPRGESKSPLDKKGANDD